MNKFSWRDILLFAVLLILAWALYRGFSIQTKFAEEGKEAHDYLCYQKVVAIPKRIQSSLDYLTDVQTGVRTPIPGITFNDIQNSIERDEATLRALSRVHC